MTQAILSMPSEPSLLIRRALRRVDVRLRSARSIKGLGVTVLVASVLAVLGMAVDFSWNLPIAARWAIWSIWVVDVVLFVSLGVVGPWLRKTSWIDLAAVAERADPKLEERLTGSIALLDQSIPANGSPSLIAALADDAAGHISEFDPKLVKASGRPLRWLSLGIAAVVIVAIPSVIRPDPFLTLSTRFFAPWLDIEKVGWFVIEVTPGDKDAAIGTEFPVEARLVPRFGSMRPPETATLEWTDERGSWFPIAMTPQATSEGSSPKAFAASLPKLVDSCRYRVSTTSARSRAYQVSAVSPPFPCEFSARIEPPAYTKLPASDAKDPERIEAIEGSRVVLSFYSCSPYRKFTLVWPSLIPGGSKLVETPPPADNKHAVVPVEAEASGPFVLTLFDSVFHPGLNGQPQTRQISVKPDASPTLKVQGPPARSEGRPDDVLQLGIAARDDFGVASVEVHYEIRRDGSGAGAETQAGKTSLKLEGMGTTVARGVALLPLRDLALQPGDSVAYRVLVLDNRPAPKGPNQTWSDARTITVSAKAEPMIAKDDRLRRESFQARLDEIRVANASNRRETEQLRYAADAAQRTGAAWDAGRDADLAAREVEARSVEDKLQLLARDLQSDPTFEPLARPTRQAAEVEAEAGRAQLEQSRKATDSGKRLAELRQADARLGSLGNRLDEIRRKFDALAKLDLDRQKLRDLAAKEDALAAEAAQGGDKDKLARDQDELRRALDALLAQSPGLRANLLVAQSEEAAKLAQKARALAEKQRAEARKTSEAPRASNPLRELAQAQKDLEDDARRLALEVDDPLAENGRGRLDTDAVRRPVEPIERGDLPEAVRKLEEAEDGLRRLTRDVEDIPNDPKALARRLARRQDLLANDVAATLGESRRKDLPADEQAAIAERSKPLAERQAEIAQLAEKLVPPEAQKGQARDAAQAASKAAENLRDFKPKESENLQNNARRALNQLAEALADPNRLRDEARQKIDQAKRKEEDVLRDVERAVAETQPRLDKLDADAKAATDLAEKLAPLAPRQKEAAEALSKLELEPRLIPQRDRAAARATKLASAIQAVRDQAPPRRPDAKPVPPGPWRIVGPLPTINARIPFDPAAPVDFNTPVKLADGKTFAWKPAQIEGDEGRVDLGKAFNRNDNQTAFAVAEIVSPTRRKTQLSMGSDDTLTVWLNGKTVFEVGGSRSFNPGQDKIEVELNAGVNRLVARCGNGNGEWQFAVNVSPAPPEGFDPEKSRRLRESLLAARADAMASLYRLEQKSHGRMTADDLAAVLADEQKLAAEALAKERSQPPLDDPTPRENATKDRQRLATAIRNLPVADEAPALHKEAIRLAEAAAKPDADPKDAEAAAEAAAALARRLGEGMNTKEVAEALARAERALEAEPDPAQVADRQKAIAAELTHEGGKKSEALDQAEQAVREAADQSKVRVSGVPTLPPSALQARARAIEALDKLATDAPQIAANEPPKPADPEPAKPAVAVPPDPSLGLGPEQAARAADLARRQRQIRERLQSAMAERVAPQQDLKRETQALARDLAELRDRTKEMNARSQWQAQNAAELAGEQAPKSMEQGANQLAQGKLDQARDAQRQAADQVERAAQAAEDAAAGLKAEGVADAGENAANTPSNGLAEARDSLRGVSRKLAQGPNNPSAAQAAVPEMRQAAESLRAAAQASARTPNTPPMGEADPNGDPNLTANAAGVAEADLAALQELIKKKTGRQWGELPGHLRTEILQLSKGRYREDYARLIQLYFKEIAADAGKTAKP